MPGVTPWRFNWPTPTTLYVGTGGGVFKSTNGGAKWSALNTGLIVTSVGALGIDPATPTTLYAGGGDVFKSMDGGAKWSVVNTGLPEFTEFTPWVSYPATPTTLYTGTSDGVFKSTDGGAKWIALNTGLITTQIP